MDKELLLSIINTKLRDKYPSLDDLCEEENYVKEEIVSSLKNIGYIYSEKLNQFKGEEK